MRKRVLQISLAINFLFIVGTIIIIYKKGGFNYISEKLGNSAIKPYTSHYYDRKSLLEILPLDSCDIIFFGNSLTEYCEWSELFNNSKVKNRGIGGDDTQGALERIDGILVGKPKKIFIEIGSNDFAIGRNISDILGNYEKIILKIKSKSPNTKIYLQSVLPVKEHIGLPENNVMIVELNQGIENLAKKHQIVFINLFPLFLKDNNLDSSFSSDGVHFKGIGYVKWKETIKQYIE